MSFRTYLKKLGRRLARHRLRRGLKQTDVQEKCGITYRHYQNIEAGKVNVKIETLYLLARLYRVRVEQLVRDDG